MKRVHLLGHPVSQSLSPVMQNAAFQALGLDWEYSVLDVPPTELVAALERLEADPVVVGCNVTVPHKIAVFEWLTKNGRTVREGALRASAVNTLFRGSDGHWSGDSTDFFGAYDALKRILPDLGATGPFPYHIAILGTGGSAQTLAMGFARHSTYPRSIAIFGRNLDKAEHLRDLARTCSPASMAAPSPDPVPVEAFPMDRFAEWNVGKQSIVIQTTTVGMATGEAPNQSPVPSGSVSVGQIAFDLVYKPSETRFLQDAQSNGARIVPGIWMLVGQGARSAERWINSTREYTGPAFANFLLTSAMEAALHDKGLL